MDLFVIGLSWLDYAAVAVFGATGALAAARRARDWPVDDNLPDACNER